MTLKSSFVLNLRDKDRNQILKIAEETFSCEVILWAYGSRVNGNSHDASDLDLVIRGPELKELNNTELENFKEALKDSNIPIIVQVFDWARLPSSFKKNILASYIPL